MKEGIFYTNFYNKLPAYSVIWGDWPYLLSKLGFYLISSFTSTFFLISTLEHYWLICILDSIKYINILIFYFLFKIKSIALKWNITCTPEMSVIWEVCVSWQRPEPEGQWRNGKFPEIKDYSGGVCKSV